MSYEIKDLEAILLPKYIGNDRKIIHCSVKRLTSPGENYGSLMLAIDLKIMDEIGKENTLYIAAKAVPKNEFIQQAFKTPLSFKKELEFYRTVIPILREFHIEEGIADEIKFFPELYGGRLGVGPDLDNFDNDAIILLENLKKSGFSCADRKKGFNLESAKFILKDLSMLHAVPLALKLRRPELFIEKVLPYLDDIRAFSDMEDKIVNHMIEEIVQLVEESPECIPFVKRVRNELTKGFELAGKPKQSREPFATLIHCDFWVNNTMVKCEGDKVVANKIVDFQLLEYGSPVRDLLFFIFDSVDIAIVAKYCDYLIEFYHENFMSTLDKFTINTHTFSLDNFKEEMDACIKESSLFCQCLIMLKPMFADENSVKELESACPEDFLEKVAISQDHKDKLWMIVKEFAKRNWI